MCIRQPGYPPIEKNAVTRLDSSDGERTTKGRKLKEIIKTTQTNAKPKEEEWERHNNIRRSHRQYIETIRGADEFAARNVQKNFGYIAATTYRVPNPLARLRTHVLC